MPDIIYEGPIFRPPSEAPSLIIQATVGCSNNACTFCGAYLFKKFRVRNIDEIKKDLLCAKNFIRTPRRIFLADGDALAIPHQKMIEILKEINSLFPHIERISTYACPQNLLEKSIEELIQLRENKLLMVYLGVETGLSELLQEIRKGVSREEMIIAGKKAKESQIKLSATIILGLAGQERSLEHSQETASLLNEIQPDYVGALTLMLVPNTTLWRKKQKGEFVELNNFEYLEELGVLISNLNLNHCIFRSNHASNYLAVGGILPYDKEKMLESIKKVVAKKDVSFLRPEFLRGL